MQLLVLMLMLMLSGNGASVKELQPILESIGGEEASQALKQAEELSDMVSAVQALTGTVGGKGSASPADCGSGEVEEPAPKNSPCSGYPLAPIASVADERITYCLSRYVALGE